MIAETAEWGFWMQIEETMLWSTGTWSAEPRLSPLTDVGSQDVVDKAVEIALEIEEHRRAAAPPDEVVSSRRVDSHTRD